MVALVKEFTSADRHEVAGRTTSKDVEDLTRALDASGRFHRDSRLGRIYHRGAASYRELRATDSVHVIVDANRVLVHVDRISPLKRRRDGSVRLSFTRILAHNVAGAHGDITRRLRRRADSHRRAGDPTVVATLVPEQR
jgi:hypothetical protein